MSDTLLAIVSILLWMIMHNRQSFCFPNLFVVMLKKKLQRVKIVVKCFTHRSLKGKLLCVGFFFTGKSMLCVTVLSPLRSVIIHYYPESHISNCLALVFKKNSVNFCNWTCHI